MYDPMAIPSLSSFTTVQLTNKSCAKIEQLVQRMYVYLNFVFVKQNWKKQTILSFRHKIKTKMKKMKESGLLFKAGATCEVSHTGITFRCHSFSPLLFWVSSASVVYCGSDTALYSNKFSTFPHLGHFRVFPSHVPSRKILSIFITSRPYEPLSWGVFEYFRRVPLIMSPLKHFQVFPSFFPPTLFGYFRDATFPRISVVSRSTSKSGIFGYLLSHVSCLMFVSVLWMWFLKINSEPLSFHG